MEEQGVHWEHPAGFWVDPLRALENKTHPQEMELQEAPAPPRSRSVITPVDFSL